MNELVTLLSQATKTLPQLRFAWGLLGIAIVAALIMQIVGSDRAAIVVVSLALIGTVLVFVASVAFGRSEKASLPAIVFVWAIVIFFITFLLFTISAFAISKPRNWANLLGISSEIPSQQELSGVKGDCIISVGGSEDVNGVENDAQCVEIGSQIGSLLPTGFSAWSRRYDEENSKCVYRFRKYARTKSVCSTLATDVLSLDALSGEAGRWVVGSGFLVDTE